MTDKGFSSRKFIVTMTGMFLCFALAVAGILLKQDPSSTALLGIGGGIGAYNWANVNRKNNEQI